MNRRKILGTIIPAVMIAIGVLCIRHFLYYGVFQTNPPVPGGWYCQDEDMKWVPNSMPSEKVGWKKCHGPLLSREQYKSALEDNDFKKVQWVANRGDRSLFDCHTYLSHFPPSGRPGSCPRLLGTIETANPSAPYTIFFLVACIIAAILNTAIGIGLVTVLNRPPEHTV